MNFLIDENIPYAESFFESLGQVKRFAGRELTSEELIDIDVLLVRSITKVDANLLSHANSLKFVGTATIGEDHIDKEALAKRNIVFSSAPGCNANSVAEFVISALFVIAERYSLDFSGKTASIIGLGNIGSNLARKLSALGLTVLGCDPLKSEPPSHIQMVDLETALSQGDIVTFHTPLTSSGSHPTHHLLNEQNIGLLKADVTLINASRGEVIDNQALLTELQRRTQDNEPQIKLILDVWEGEPNPLKSLIPLCELTSAHIAGYSLEGKGRGTEILYNKVCQLFKKGDSHELSDFLPTSTFDQIHINNDDESNPKDLTQHSVNLSHNSPLKALIHLIFDVRRDDALFRNNLEQNGFDWLRKNYPIRREWSSISVNCTNPTAASRLKTLGFKIK